MGAADRFKNANTKFSERGEYLIPIQKEETYEVEVAGVKTGKTATRTVYDSPANYECKIKRCYWKTARDKAEYYIVEYEVLKSNNPKVSVGALRTWMQSMDGDVGNTATTDFMFAALGKDRRNAIDLAEIKKLDEAGELPGMLASTLDDPTDPVCENALKDLIVQIEVKQIFTKKKQEPFNLHTFFPAKKAA